MTRPGQINSLYSEIHNERVRAHMKHAPNGGSMEDKNWDSQRWLPVLMEEMGEVARVICEKNLGKYGDWGVEQHKAVTKDLREELIQLAAMATAWVASIDETGPEREPNPPKDRDVDPRINHKQLRTRAAINRLVDALQNQYIDEQGRVALSMNVRSALSLLEPHTRGSLLDWALNYVDAEIRRLRATGETT